MCSFCTPHSERPFFLSRGYGGQLTGPVRVNPAIHRARDVGDEPLLLTRLAPTIVARDRVAGAKFAQFAGASVVVMDDGLQNSVACQGSDHHLSSMAAAASATATSFRRGRCGRRSSLQFDRAQALIVVGAPDGAAFVLDRAQRRGMAIFHARLEPDRSVIAAIGRRKVLAFAGIGDPEKFFATLTAAGIEVAERASFADHHRYTAAQAQELIARAQAE